MPNDCPDCDDLGHKCPECKEALRWELADEEYERRRVDE